MAKTEEYPLFSKRMPPTSGPRRRALLRPTVQMPMAWPTRAFPTVFTSSISPAIHVMAVDTPWSKCAIKSVDIDKLI